MAAPHGDLLACPLTYNLRICHDCVVIKRRREKKLSLVIPVCVAVAGIFCDRPLRPSAELDDAPLCAFQHSSPSARAVQWAISCDTSRAPRAPNSSASILIFEINSQGEPSRQIRALCMAAGESLLPDRDGRNLYLVRSGLLYWVDPHTGTNRHVTTRGVTDWQFSSLLGFSRSSQKLQILAEMVHAKNHESTELWLLTVEGASANGVMLAKDDSRIQGSRSLAKHFVLPRCKDDDYRSCLVVTQLRTIGHESRRGSPTIPVNPPLSHFELQVLDVSWAPGREEMIVLAQGCPDKEAQATGDSLDGEPMNHK